jgi:hypothetical protein
VGWRTGEVVAAGGGCVGVHPFFNNREHALFKLECVWGESAGVVHHPCFHGVCHGSERANFSTLVHWKVWFAKVDVCFVFEFYALQVHMEPTLQVPVLLGHQHHAPICLLAMIVLFVYISGYLRSGKYDNNGEGTSRLARGVPCSAKTLAQG